MRIAFGLALVAALLVNTPLPADGDKLSPGKQLSVRVRIFAGDPLGSREAGTLKVLAEPRLGALEGAPFSFFSGSELAVPDGPRHVQFIEVGRKVEGRSWLAKGGKIRLDLTLSTTTLGDRAGDRLRLHTQSTRTITTAKPGQVVKLRWGKGSADNQVWAEVSVEEVKP